MTLLPLTQESTVPASFLQSRFWAQFKTTQGWDSIHVMLSDLDGRPVHDRVPLSVLIRRIPHFGFLAYIPLGPSIPCLDAHEQGRLLKDIATSLRPYLPKNTLCVRFDPPWGTQRSNASTESADPADPGRTDKLALHGRPTLPAGPARPAPVHIQPPDTVVLDLTKDEETLLSEMKAKWRYNIKLGEKKGVTIRFYEGSEGASRGIDIFYRLYLETAKRDGIAIHQKAYYQDLLSRSENAEGLGSNPDNLSVRVYVAEFEDQPLAAIITLFFADEAVYLYGASSNEKRNLMPAYALQWQAIRDARSAGCKTYDFYGIPPSDDPTHPMHGLYRFKTGFGGMIIHRVGSLDIPLRPVVYRLFILAERARSFWFKRAVKFFRRETRPRS